MDAYLYTDYHWKVYKKPATVVASEVGNQMGVRDRGRLAFHGLRFKIFGYVSCTGIDFKYK